MLPAILGSIGNMYKNSMKNKLGMEGEGAGDMQDLNSPYKEYLMRQQQREGQMPGQEMSPYMQQLMMNRRRGM